jgi:hypothetical protein
MDGFLIQSGNRTSTHIFLFHLSLQTYNLISNQDIKKYYYYCNMNLETWTALGSFGMVIMFVTLIISFYNFLVGPDGKGPE